MVDLDCVDMRKQWWALRNTKKDSTWDAAIRQRVVVGKIYAIIYERPQYTPSDTASNKPCTAPRQSQHKQHLFRRIVVYVS